MAEIARQRHQRAMAGEASKARLVGRVSAPAAYGSGGWRNEHQHGDGGESGGAGACA